MNDQKLIICRKHTEQEYAVIFATYIKSTMEFEAMSALVQPVIDSLNGRGVSLLSIGAGTGYFENHLRENLGLNITSLYAIEPNYKQAIKLQETIASWDIECTVSSDFFNTDFTTEERFDIVLMSHCLYHIVDPVAVVCKAKSLLKKDGKVLVFLQNNTGGHELHKFLLQFAQFREPYLPLEHLLTAEVLSEALTKQGIQHDIHIAPSSIEVGDFVERKQTATANHVVSFLLQTDYDKLPEEKRHEIYEFVKERSMKDDSGKYWFPHGNGMIVIS